MPTPIEISIKNFNGGISDSSRKPSVSEFQISKMFDIFSDPSKLTPYRSLETDTATSISSTDLKQYLVRDFVYASTSVKLYGLGQTGAGLTKIYKKQMQQVVCGQLLPHPKVMVQLKTGVL